MFWTVSNNSSSSIFSVFSDNSDPRRWRWVATKVISWFCQTVKNVSIISGNQLEARQNPSAGECIGDEGCRLSESCRTTSGDSIGDWFRLWLDVWQLRSSQLGCWADTIRLVYDRSNIFLILTIFQTFCSETQDKATTLLECRQEYKDGAILRVWNI